ncbi:uncharacterized protein N0V89_010964 [Didymosphaeria variabile]|uniref:Enoyl reductase (ER) domain-containing protein n=1 Tax=Didymosphaeria variabile TaxID=1932322 RepID=A0A9W9C5Z9_9PLEO|nr:uncharacterized protein N0V89_010964 [Didymosphaeria variabile]KAJ4347030.1 hypothetical protein N0V89_010964 [Didymosphaeria variabile]
MRAVSLSAKGNLSIPYSPTNPAPSSALRVFSDVKIPQPSRSGELLIRVNATTVIRDALTWPETYIEEKKILGHDFAGTVVSVNDESHDMPFKVGDEVYGMTEGSRAGAWAEYMVVNTEEACVKPSRLSWVEAAAVPLSALTAYQALFEKASIRAPDFTRQGRASGTHQVTAMKEVRILVIGASGCVGNYLVQLAKLAGAHVTAASSSNERNKDFLCALGADDVVEYSDLTSSGKQYEVIIDTVGGSVLKTCWSLVADNGSLISVDSASWNFVREHRDSGVAQEEGNVNALFFIVSPSRRNLEQLSAALDDGLLKVFVASTLPLEDVRLAYDMSSRFTSKRGKVVLVL